MNPLEQFVLFLVSLIANTFSAFSGGGAGLIQFPLLIFLGLSFSVALATHKIASVALGVGAILRYLSTSQLERKFVLMMICAGVPGVILGGSFVLLIPEDLAIISLGILTGGLGMYSIFKPTLGQIDNPQHRDTRGYIHGSVMFFIRHIEWLTDLGNGPICDYLACDVVWPRLSACSGLYVDFSGHILEWCWRNHARYFG